MVIQFFCYYLLYQRNTRLVKTFILDQQQYFIFAYQSNRDWIRIENQRKGLQTAIMVDGEVVICLWSSGANACGALEGWERRVRGKSCRAVGSHGHCSGTSQCSLRPRSFFIRSFAPGWERWTVLAKSGPSLQTVTRHSFKPRGPPPTKLRHSSYRVKQLVFGACAF